nr:IS3 family transposase [Solimicrobium silvestre]
MSKYTKQFKLTVVKRYLDSSMGYVAVAQQYGIDRSFVQKWSKQYALHGEAGLDKKFSHYNAEFKLSVLQSMWDKQLSYRETAILFDIRNLNILSNWERSYHSEGIQALTPRTRGRPKAMSPPKKVQPQPAKTDESRSREELLEEVNYLRMENAYLKKLKASSGAGTGSVTQKAQVVQELRQNYPIAGLLKIAGIARSTFYYQQKALMVKDKYADLKKHIRTIYARHKGRYGYRRITASIKQLGVNVNHKTVQRLMAELGLKSLVRIKKYRSYKGSVGRIAPNLLQRQFVAANANQKWVTDVTEFNVAGEKLYLSPILDLYNGEIIAYETSRRPVFKMVSDMLKKAWVKLKPDDKPMLHSDQGWQYQMSAYQRILEQRQVVQSMSRKENCLDNAAMESFFGVLKSEYYYLNKFKSVEELEKGLANYIRYYNYDRIKLKLKGLSPVQYRNQPSVA